MISFLMYRNSDSIHSVGLYRMDSSGLRNKSISLVLFLTSGKTFPTTFLWGDVVDHIDRSTILETMMYLSRSFKFFFFFSAELQTVLSSGLFINPFSLDYSPSGG